MKIVGILTEFNPFHNGHAWFLGELRRRLGEETAVVCVMSGSFVQRGEPALMCKHVRAEAALRHGADLILELPVGRALSSAERFAWGGMALLRAAGCVTHLAFGSECGSVPALERVASCLSSEAYRQSLRRFLGDGMSFAACRQAAVRSILGEEDAAVLDGANNSLGVEYLKAAAQLDWPCEPVTVCRRGASHDSAGTGEFPSASALRALLAREDWTAAEDGLPPEALALYRAEFSAGRAPVTLSGAERLVLARLRTMEEADWARLPDCGEGLHHRLYRAAQSAADLDGLLRRAKTKRYALSRLRRIVMCAWLGIDAAAAALAPQYLRVLGCTGRGRCVLAQMRAAAALPVLVKPADVRMLPEAAQAQFRLEARATELFSLTCPRLEQAVPGAEWRTGPVILP